MHTTKNTTFELISIYSKCTMGYQVDQNIKDKYSLYQKLLNDRKSIFESVIDISEIRSNANFLEQEVPVQHLGITEQVIFIVVVKINDFNYFQFKLKCSDLSKIPFFRYDSDGDTHRNYDGVTPLAESSIPTPHFHHYNEKGVCLAYKTEKMLDETEMKALEDINLCIAYFCQESNINPLKEKYPTFTINSKELPLDFTLIDPLLNVKFQ
ncbi:hypothetical protein JZU68_04230 [bacterium]|jgi:hypothetical protein|nr:hypothetical protein [bacterium]